MKEKTGDVVLLVGSLQMGGSERMMIQAANHLSVSCPVTLLTLTPGETLKDEIRKQVRVVQFNKNRTSLALFPLIAFLRKEKPVALFSTQIHINLIAMVAKLFAQVQTKMILIEPTPTGAHFNTFKSRSAAINRQLVRFLYPKADAIIAVSNPVKEDLLKNRFGRPEQIHVIFNPIVNDSLKEGMKKEVADAYFETGLPVIIGLGRLAPVKNFELLIRAFAILEKRIDCRLLIIGEGAERKKLSGLITESGLNDKAKLQGNVLNPYPWLKRAAVCVVTSFYEGGPAVLVEAMACGAQAVSVDCPGGVRDVLEDGKSGRIVPMNDPAALADAIEDAIRHPVAASKLLESAMRYDAGKATTEYLGLVNKLSN
ncbi:MAG: glycosyltransferase [Bacteroidetes bacterium]|nr:glycosyltransferase [Bacteroidota bacterium]